MHITNLCCCYGLTDFAADMDDKDQTDAINTLAEMMSRDKINYNKTSPEFFEELQKANSFMDHEDPNYDPYKDSKYDGNMKDAGAGGETIDVNGIIRDNANHELGKELDDAVEDASSKK